MKYWLLKTEPSVFSVDDLKAMGKDHWDGIRNYQARNLIRDEMNPGDQVIIYHSNAKPPGAAGTGEVVSKAYPDPTQFDPHSKYFDPKSDPENPRWFVVDVAWRSTFAREIPLSELRDNTKLAEMQLLRKGNRLSVMPLLKNEFSQILKMV